MVPVEPGVGVGKVAPLVGAPALGACQCAVGDQSHQRMRVGRELFAGRRRRARVRRGARAPRGWRWSAPVARRGVRRMRVRLGGARGAGAGSASAARAARAAEHEALGQRIGGEPVGAVQPGAGALADRVQARERRAALEVGGDSTHHVVGGRRDRHQLALGVDARAAQAR